MKSRFIVILLFVFLLGGYISASKDSKNTPEDALYDLKEENRNVHFYGSTQVNKSLVLMVFKGYMNDKDIWVADIQNQKGHWKVEKIIKMDQSLYELSETHSIHKDDEIGYELGYLKGDSTDIEKEANTTVIPLEDESDWKVWIKY
ncbi:hypothetical protein BACCIP111895_03377 [Neobacillus rhizosphaerae]|uniref:Uncharacterized protein n=1 Tax=Neobacillus rhizosphaerae TaxID=2880965 RepID=A0ABM9EU55_9BACI|nr:hypothetical protein [Neobacillus rhizosphaerae]CAH2716193.1 hypothetical protein BACCIP111895_03377 [Neobacillus rhizosphaerae]